MSNTAAEARLAAGDLVIADLRAALGQVRLGDRGTLPRLRELAEDTPELWERFGDIAARAEAAWIELAAGDNPDARAAVARAVADLKADLAGPDPAPVERLLVDRVAACWLQAGYADAAAAQAGDVGLKQAEFLVRRQNAAQCRYLAAVAALATYRRLTAAGPRPSVGPAGSRAAPKRARAFRARGQSRDRGPLRLVDAGHEGGVEGAGPERRDG
jgi:hypothetical protein